MPFNCASIAAGDGHRIPRRLEQGVPLRLDRLQLRQQDLEPVQLADDLRLQMRRQGPAVAGPQLFQPLAPIPLRSGS